MDTPDEVMYEVLKYIKREGKEPPAHKQKYLDSLYHVGFTMKDWDKVYLTEFGESMLNTLRNKFEKW